MTGHAKDPHQTVFGDGVMPRTPCQAVFDDGVLPRTPDGAVFNDGVMLRTPLLKRHLTKYKAINPLTRYNSLKMDGETETAVFTADVCLLPSSVDACRHKI